MDSAEAVGRLSEAERDDVLLADFVVRGRDRAGEGDVYAVVEVSAGIGPYDVERAARRAALLGRLHPSLAVVAGECITEDAERHARERGVWRMLDERDEMPEVRVN